MSAFGDMLRAETWRARLERAGWRVSEAATGVTPCRVSPYPPGHIACLLAKTRKVTPLSPT